MTKPAHAIITSTVTVAAWLMVGVCFAVVWRLPVPQYPALLWMLLASVATFRLMLLLEPTEQPQRVHLDTRAIPVNHADGRREQVTIESGSPWALRDWEDDLPIVVHKWNHYMRYLAYERTTPSIRSAEEEGLSRAQYRALFRWLVNTDWYEVNNRSDRYNNQQGGDWTWRGDGVLEMMRAGRGGGAVMARYYRPSPNGETADTVR